MKKKKERRCKEKSKKLYERKRQEDIWVAYEMKCSRADARNSDEKLAEFSSFFSFFFFKKKTKVNMDMQARKKGQTCFSGQLIHRGQDSFHPTTICCCYYILFTRYIT